jgi:hypothetical protein
LRGAPCWIVRDVSLSEKPEIGLVAHELSPTCQYLVRTDTQSATLPKQEIDHVEQRRKTIELWTQSRIKKSKTLPAMPTTQSRIKSYMTTMLTTAVSNNNNDKAYETMKMVADQTDGGYAMVEKRCNEFALENKYTKTQTLGELRMHLI